MPDLSRGKAYCIFAGVLVAYTIQCELASYLNRTGYSKPFFLLYLTHSSYILIGILHFSYLFVNRIPIAPLIEELQDAIRAQLSVPKSRNVPFPLARALQRLIALTILIALPAGVWYSAISLTSMTSLTALYNLNAFWAYILSIYYSRSEHWQIRSGLAVGIACFGVLVMTYGDSRKASASLPSLPDTVQNSSFLGDMLGLVSSFACGFYEVWYKRYIALPPASESMILTPSLADYSRINSRVSEASEGSPKHSADLYDTGADSDAVEGPLYPSKAITPVLESTSQSQANPGLFLLHSNTITSLIGVSTICLLWVPIPFLHWMGWERFDLPMNGTMYAAVCGVCFCGVMFNAGFMILLSAWGPVVTSVGNLFTLILVAISDEVIALTNGSSALSLPTLAGSGFILAAFGMLITGPLVIDAHSKMGAHEESLSASGS